MLLLQFVIDYFQNTEMRSLLSFIEVCAHLYLSSLSPPSCVLSSISLTSTQVSVRSHVMDLQPIRGQTGSCLQLLNISQYLAFVTLLHRKSYTLQLD